MQNMIFKTSFIGIACLWAFSIVITSCSSSDDDPENSEQATDGRKLRQLTIAEVPITRAVLTDNTTTLGATWSAGDKATYFNLTSFTDNVMDYGSLTSSSSGGTSAFTGTVRCSEGDKLALFYPAKDPITSGTDRGKYVISLSGQKGTLDDIAPNYHYIYGVGTVNSVTESTASATISDTKSLLALCKFTFKDVETNAIPVKTLTINYADVDPEYGPSTLGYPLSGKVDPSETFANVSAIPAAQTEWNGPLTINLDTEISDGVYVALFPVTGDNFQFTVTGSKGTYEGTASAKLNAGKYYPVTLKLSKQ